MPRPRRVHVPGALYYVTTRAAEGQPLFRDDTDYVTYLSLLQAYADQYAVKLFAYVLLAEQVHLVVELTGEATISELMHALNSRYTKHVAARHGRTAHVFQDRFKSTIAEKAPSLLWLTGFVHRLPRSADAAGDWRSYRWSSYPAYLAGGVDADRLDLRQEVAEVLLRAADELRGAGYASYVEALTEQELRGRQELLRQPVIGSEAFCARIKAAGSSVAATALPAAPAVPVRRMSPVWALAGSLAVGLLSMGAALLYARSAATLQRAVMAAQTVTQPARFGTTAVPVDDSDTQPASLAQPITLRGTRWALQIRDAQAAADAPAQMDEIAFDAGRVTSQMLRGQGFTGTNYTLTKRQDGWLVWETMQTGSNGEVVCWRGETDGRSMRGILTRQPAGQATQNFVFAGNAQRPTREI